MKDLTNMSGLSLTHWVSSHLSTLTYTVMPTMTTVCSTVHCERRELSKALVILLKFTYKQQLICTFCKYSTVELT